MRKNHEMYAEWDESFFSYAAYEKRMMELRVRAMRELHIAEKQKIAEYERCIGSIIRRMSQDNISAKRMKRLWMTFVYGNQKMACQMMDALKTRCYFRFTGGEEFERMNKQDMFRYCRKDLLFYTIGRINREFDRMNNKALLKTNMVLEMAAKRKEAAEKNADE